jgi:hypothetical protein
MPIEVWRPGDYRVCPSCGTRHKVQDLRCTRCRTVLAGAPVRHAAPSPAMVSAPRSSRGLRAFMAAALVVALAAGLWVRSLFRGANLQDSVEASSLSATAAPNPAPSWQPPVLSYPPIVGYNQGVPPSMAALAIQGAPPTTGVEAQPTGMVSIAPPSEPTRKTAFTNDDLMRTRSGPGVVTMAAAEPPAAPGSVSAPVTASAAAPRVEAVSGDAAREWVSRVRDREDDVQQAQSKVRRMEAEVEARRAQAAAVAGDADAREKAQRDVTDALEDLDKAERKLSEKQRDLDEVKVAARAAGLRFER